MSSDLRFPSPRGSPWRRRRGPSIRGGNPFCSNRGGDAGRRGFSRSCLRSEERRVGKSVDLGGRRIIKKKKKPHNTQKTKKKNI